MNRKIVKRRQQRKKWIPRKKRLKKKKSHSQMSCLTLQSNHQNKFVTGQTLNNKKQITKKEKKCGNSNTKE